MNEEQPSGDWIEGTRRAVPVLVMVVALIGFAAELGKWLILSAPDPVLMGICATAASGGYFWSATLAAIRNTRPPPPLPVKTPTLDPPPDPPAPAPESAGT